jgi:uncharacterized membrane protein
VAHSKDHHRRHGRTAGAGDAQVGPLGTTAARLVGPKAEARARVVVAATIGGIAAAIVARRVPWQLTVLVGWDAGALGFLAFVWWIIAGCDSAQTAEMATREDETRATASFLLLGASTASLVGVGFALIKANAVGGAMEGILTAAAGLTVVVSWAVIQAVFTLRYAHLYFAEPVGGIDFPETKAPDYRDFAYLAFTIGMTYQVSDTALEDGLFRHTALRHALLAYLFGTVIVAMTINILAGLVR